jgi:hypothetical protein
MPPAKVSYSFLDDFWLKDLIDKYGQPGGSTDGGSHWGNPVSLNSYVRTCWVWFPKEEFFNHYLSIDDYPSYWLITAGRHGNDNFHSTHVELKLAQRERPSPECIRTVLVMAEFLEAK